MNQFHEGQDVEVATPFIYGGTEQELRRWRKAKIVYPPEFDGHCYRCLVEFLDGTRTVFDAEHIRAVKPIDYSDSFPSDYECADGNCE